MPKSKQEKNMSFIGVGGWNIISRREYKWQFCPQFWYESFSAHNPVLWLAAGGGSRALIGPAMMGPRPRRDLESRLWPLCVSQAAPDIGSVLEIISPALNIFMWERDLATWSSKWREWVRFAGQGKCFSVFKLEAVSGVWSNIGPVLESAIIIRWLCHISRTWSSKPR